MSDTFTYKTVYLWVFVQECDKRPDGLLVRWTSDVRKSKYTKDDGTPKPDYIEFRVDGDDKLYQLQIEAPQVHSYLSKIPQNVKMMAKMGGRDEETTIICEDIDGNLISSEEGETGQGWGPGPEEPQEEPVFKSAALRLESLLEDVQGITSRFYDNHGRHPTDEEIRAAITLFINR